jgi:flagellar hook-associated protein 2
MNGVTLYRDSNTVTDAISGTTLTLKSGSPTAVTVKIEPDAEQALESIKNFIAKYNDVLDHLNQNTTVDRKAGRRGSLALDPVFSALAGQLRATEATRVTSPAPGRPNSLAALGIRAGVDGKLGVADESTFRSTFRTEPAAVSDVLHGPAGVVGALDRLVASYSSYNGQIALSQNQLTLRIGAFDAQITRTNGLLAARQVRLEDELARGQSLLQKLKAQASQMSRITALLGQSFGVNR